MTEDEYLRCLRDIGRLLDEAVDQADACGEPMLAAQIAHALSALDLVFTRMRATRESRPPGEDKL